MVEDLSRRPVWTARTGSIRWCDLCDI